MAIRKYFRDRKIIPDQRFDIENILRAFIVFYIQTSPRGKTMFVNSSHAISKKKYPKNYQKNNIGFFIKDR